MAAMEETPRISKALPWVERYRPKSVNDIKSQEAVVSTLLSAIQQKSLPHLLFYGPPGTGKTSTALALARALYGPLLYKKRILEMNASDERGIGVVRDKIKIFAQAAVGTESTPGFPCPHFKIIILDEADAMTNDAQAALRRTIENFSKVTRFCMICNYVSRIIEPLASRCAKFRFKPLANEHMLSRLQFIVAEENLKCSKYVYEKILELSKGDMRKAVTLLQSTFTLYGNESKKVIKKSAKSSPEEELLEGIVKVENVVEIAGVLEPGALNHLWAMIEKGDYDALADVVEAIQLEGYAAMTILDQLLDHILANEKLTDVQKGKMGLALGRVDKRLIDGANDGIQILDLCAECMRICTAA